MSRKIKLSVPVEVVVRDRDARLCGILSRLSRRPGVPVKIALSRLAEEMALSPDTLRRAVSSCCAEGYLTVTENYLDNGTQLENSYTLTKDGIAIAKAAHEAGMVA